MSATPDNPAVDAQQSAAPDQSSATDQAPASDQSSVADRAPATDQPPVAPPQPGPGAAATMVLVKRASRATIQPGQEMGYEIEASCSAQQASGCVDATITDTLPAEWDVTSVPGSSSEREVTYDPVTRLLTVKFIIPLAQPTGGTGLQAGSTRLISVGVRLPAETPVLDGATIDNQAQITATNADPQEAAVDTTVDVPVVVRPVATKTLQPSSAIAGSDAVGSVTLGVRNGSSTSAAVKTLSATDDTAATFNAFDLVDAGTLLAWPTGADRVVVSVFCPAVLLGCPQPSGGWVDSAVQSGSTPLILTAPTLPPGLALADMTGIRFNYSNSAAADLPFTATGEGTVSFGTKLRDTYRDAPGTPILGPETVNNCNTPSAVDAATQTTTGTPACAKFDIQPDNVEIGVNKTLFPDNRGNFTTNGNIVVNQDSGVSMAITVKNLSRIPLSELKIVEQRDPNSGGGSELDKIDLTNGKFTWPAGASNAELVVTCRSGNSPSPQPYVNPGGSNPTTTLANFGCEPGERPGHIELTFTGTKDGLGTIAPGTTGVLSLHGTAARVTSTDVSDRLVNCADGSGRTPGSGSGSGFYCADAPVQNPTPGLGNTVKNSAGVGTIVPGQPLAFNLSFRNTGNIPVSNVYLVDPADPTAAGNVFDLVQLRSLRTVSAPAGTLLQVWDPLKGGSCTADCYVAYNAVDSALLERAKGIRVIVTGNIAVGDTVRIQYEVNVRPSTPNGTTFTNCAAVGIGPDPNNWTSFCNANAITVVQTGSAAAALQKLFEPLTITRPTPGLAPQTVTVKHQIRNTGTLYLDTLGLEDDDAGFFDAVTFTGGIHVNFPPGADRVQVDVWAPGAGSPPTYQWITGSRTSSSTPTIPAGVTASQVKGIRVTFSAASNGNAILPGSNFPSAGQCKNASVCFTVEPRENLDSNPHVPIPNTISDHTDAFGNNIGFGPVPPLGADAFLTVTEGSRQLSFTKGPDSRIGPGESAPFHLVYENSGTTALESPQVVDPIPTGLTFNPVQPGAPTGQHYLLNYANMPPGYPLPDSVAYTEAKDDPSDPNRVTSLRWLFLGPLGAPWRLPVGARIELTFQVKLSGVLAGTVITNSAGGTATNVICAPGGSVATDDPTYGAGTYCLDSATITSLSGNAVDAAKWSAGDPGLGFYETVHGDVVPTDDASCPQFIHNGTTYTRFPCVPMVLPGHQIRFLLRLTNTGSSKLTNTVLVDGLPVAGDTGVILSGQRGTQWSPRPTMSSDVALEENYQTATAKYTTATFPGPGFCTTQLANPPVPCGPTAFPDTSASAATTGFELSLAFGAEQGLDPGQSATWTYTMLAPVDVANGLTYPVAWNSFAQKSTFEGGVTLLAAEPPKAGVAMPYGEVHVTKSVVDLPPNVPLDPFELSYECSVTPVGGSATVVGQGDFTLTDGDTFTLPAQPAGAQCAVWETNSQGGTTANDSQANAAVVTVKPASSAPAGVPVTITNEYAAGSLVIKKTVTWDGPPAVPVGVFTIEVNCEFPAGALLPGFPLEFYLDDGASQTLNDLPAGAICDVTETDSRGATIVTITETGGARVVGRSIEVVVAPDTAGGTEVGIENLYQTGGIELIKTITGPGSQWAQGPFQFDIHCTDPNTVLPDVDFHVTLTPAHLTETMSPVPVGYSCDVTEIAAGDAGVSTPVLIDTVVIPPYVGPPPGPVVVTADNPYPAGHVKVTKTVTGDGAPLMADAVFTINVQCERDLINSAGTQIIVDEDVDLKADESYTLSTPLPMGARCWGTETETAGATSHSINYYDANHAVVVTANTPNVELTASNVYEAGALKLTKTLIGDSASFAQGPKFKFAVACTLGGVTMDTQTVELTPSQLTSSLSNLPVGATCTISETDKGDATSSTVTPETVTIPAHENPAVEVAAVNFYATGHLTVSKVVTGAGAPLVGDARFQVDVKCVRDLLGGRQLADGQEVILNRTVNLVAGQSQTLADPLPIGARCWGTEVVTAGAGATSVDHFDAAHAITVTEAAAEVRITATNSYDTTPLTVAKKLAGGPPSAGPFTFTVTCTMPSGTQPPTYPVSLPAADAQFTLAANESRTIAVPVGSTCTTKETASAGATSVAVADTSGDPGDGVTEMAGPQSVTVTNTFPPLNLTISKSVKSQVGRTVTWAIPVTNNGSFATVDPIVIIDPLPAQLSYQSYNGVGWACNAVGQTVTCTHAGPLASHATTVVELVTTLAANTTGEVVNVVHLNDLVGGATATAVLPGPGNCGSDGAGSDCGGFGPQVPLKVKAKPATTKLTHSRWTKVVTSAKTDKTATLSTSVLCRTSNGKKISGCKLRVEKGNAVQVVASRCAVRKVTVTIRATPKPSYAGEYRMKFWTRTYQVRACG